MTAVAGGIADLNWPLAVLKTRNPELRPSARRSIDAVRACMVRTCGMTPAHTQTGQWCSQIGKGLQGVAHEVQLHVLLPYNLYFLLNH